ncbi:hypothetical protein QL285_056357 [Trifolium repens]|nr:hypothetical protein QL285_056357 [Trifolium repens]
MLLWERKQRQSFDGRKHSSSTATNQPPPIYGINHSSMTSNPTPPHLGTSPPYHLHLITSPPPPHHNTNKPALPSPTPPTTLPEPQISHRNPINKLPQNPTPKSPSNRNGTSPKTTTLNPPK